MANIEVLYCKKNSYIKDRDAIIGTLEFVTHFLRKSFTSMLGGVMQFIA